MNSIALNEDSMLASEAFVASPCISVCHMQPASGWCTGCARSLDEIARWSTMDATEKRAVLERVRQRRAAMPAAPSTAPGP